MKAVGDVLPYPAKVIEHRAYFRKLEPCTCGGKHPQDDSEDDSEDEQDDSEEEGSDEEDYEGTDDDSEAFDDETMGEFFSFLGLPPPPPGSGLPPTHSTVPPPPAPAPTAPAASFSNILGEAMSAFFQPYVGGPTPASDKPADRSRTPRNPRLLPLSWKNRAHVPHSPLLHPFLAETGSVEFQRFLEGEMALYPIKLTLGDALTSTHAGMDWEKADESGERRDPNTEEVEEHPLLARAFA